MQLQCLFCNYSYCNASFQYRPTLPLHFYYAIDSYYARTEKAIANMGRQSDAIG